MNTFHQQSFWYCFYPCLSNWGMPTASLPVPCRSACSALWQLLLGVPASPPLPRTCIGLLTHELSKCRTTFLCDPVDCVWSMWSRLARSDVAEEDGYLIPSPLLQSLEHSYQLLMPPSPPCWPWFFHDFFPPACLGYHFLTLETHASRFR